MNPYRILKAQASAISAIIIAGASLIVGLAILMYLQSMLSIYSSEVQRDAFLSREMNTQVLKLIAIDSSSNTVWILLRRLDNRSIGFMIALAIENSTHIVFANCDSVKYYEPLYDNNGILCDAEDDDCIDSVEYDSVSLQQVMINVNQRWAPLIAYLNSLNLILSRDTTPICLIPYSGGNRIVKLDISQVNANKLRLFLLTAWGSEYYVIEESIVNLG